ncbi:MAG: hypothetical protein KDC34_05865 [Saprospiraceae bacterium]|nr:hypothetical protein [Saprospiraceae bacterium]
MNISILSPEKEIFKGPIKSVKVPGTLGQFQVLKNHAPIVSSLQAGEIIVVTSAGEHVYYNEETGALENGLKEGRTLTFKINSGFIEVLHNEISILVQGASVIK